jgi:hypothetical protein
MIEQVWLVQAWAGVRADGRITIDPELYNFDPLMGSAMEPTRGFIPR